MNLRKATNQEKKHRYSCRRVFGALVPYRWEPIVRSLIALGGWPELDRRKKKGLAYSGTPVLFAWSANVLASEAARSFVAARKLDGIKARRKSPSCVIWKLASLAFATRAPAFWPDCGLVLQFVFFFFLSLYMFTSFKAHWVGRDRRLQRQKGKVYATSRRSGISNRSVGGLGSRVASLQYSCHASSSLFLKAANAKLRRDVLILLAQERPVGRRKLFLLSLFFYFSFLCFLHTLCIRLRDVRSFLLILFSLKCRG